MKICMHRKIDSQHELNSVHTHAVTQNPATCIQKIDDHTSKYACTIPMIMDNNMHAYNNNMHVMWNDYRQYK